MFFERFVKSLLLIDTSSVVEQTPSDENLCETVCDKGLIEAFMEINTLIEFQADIPDSPFCDFVNQQIRQYDYASCQIRACHTLQRFFRECIVRRRLAADQAAAETIQRCYRGFIVRRKLTPEQQNIVNKFSHRIIGLILRKIAVAETIQRVGHPRMR